MKEIIGFIKAYYHEVNKLILVFCTLFISVLVWLNYQHRLEYKLVMKAGLPIPGFSGHFLVYLVGFLIPYIFLLLNRRKIFPAESGFWICLFAAPVIFAIKVSMDTHVDLSANNHWNEYWNDIIYWPLRMIVMVAILGVMSYSVS